MLWSMVNGIRLLCGLSVGSFMDNESYQLINLEHSMNAYKSTGEKNANRAFFFFYPSSNVSIRKGCMYKTQYNQISSQTEYPTEITTIFSF